MSCLQYDVASVLRAASSSGNPLWEDTILANMPKDAQSGGVLCEQYHLQQYCLTAARLLRVWQRLNKEVVGATMH